MNVLTTNNTKVYRIAADKSLPEWLAEKKKKAMKNNIDFQRRIELLQDFQFPTASTKIRLTKEKQHIIGIGTYKPVMRCWDLHELSMKWERYLDCEAVQFEILSEDWRKVAVLLANRVVEFHSSGGIYYKTRVPRICWDMVYESRNCDLLMVGSSSEIYRLNLEQGRFLQSYQSASTSINVVARNATFPLLATGSVNGLVEVWDSRTKKRPGMLAVNPFLSDYSREGKSKDEVTALEFSEDGMQLLVGTSGGHVLLFDIRSKQPLSVKDHQYGTPIKFLQFQDKDTTMSADTKILKVYDSVSGKAKLNLEAPADINDVLVYPNSGLVCMACEQPKIENYYIPAFGVAPKWCSFLDNLTEELEQDSEPTIYDDFKFITKEELEQLGLQRLVGTECLRAYMHGYFIDVRLYKKVHAIVDPTAFDKHRKEMVKEKLEKKKESRISLKRKVPKVNKDLFLQRVMLDKKEEEEKAKARRAAEDAAAGIAPTEEVETEKKRERKGKKNGVAKGSILKDDRFTALFENPDFEIDLQSEEYMKKFKHKDQELDDEMYEKLGQAMSAKTLDDLEEDGIFGDNDSKSASSLGRESVEEGEGEEVGEEGQEASGKKTKAPGIRGGARKIMQLSVCDRKA